MRTNVVIDDKLIKAALRATGLNTKREVVELGLRTLLDLRGQEQIRKYRGKLMLYDVPGELCGVRVESGDLVFGDIDGTVIVPKLVMREALSKALEKVAAENVVRDEIRAGHTLVDIFDRHGIL